jgi:hypothetical protein
MAGLSMSRFIAAKARVSAKPFLCVDGDRRQQAASTRSRKSDQSSAEGYSDRPRS